MDITLKRNANTQFLAYNIDNNIRINLSYKSVVNTHNKVQQTDFLTCMQQSIY